MTLISSSSTSSACPDGSVALTAVTGVILAGGRAVRMGGPYIDIHHVMKLMNGLLTVINLVYFPRS